MGGPGSGRRGGAEKEKVFRPTAEAVIAEQARRASCRFYRYFLDEGPLRRARYPKHVAYMAAGARWPQRGFLSGNRVGKTDVAAYEITCHVTGEYPEWWSGKRFEGPTEWWVSGDTGVTTRDIIQVAFLGRTVQLETREWEGMIPRMMVYDVARKPGVPMGVSTIWVLHKSGGISTIELKSYDQKREAFQGTGKHGIWLDEECPEDIYGECLMRTMTTGGVVLVTFTPLQGLTPFIASWLERATMEVLDEQGRSQLVSAKSEVFKGISASEVPDVDAIARVAQPTDEAVGTRYLVMASWDDAPHLTAEMKATMLKEYPPHQREARSKGIPALGSGLIWPVPEADITIAPFAIPVHWPRGYGMDIDAGAGWTAAAWMAWDREADVYYLYDVYKRSHAEPVVHASAIKARGAWIPGVADAAALLVTAHDSEQYVSLYKRLGLDLKLPDKSVETGLQEVWELLSSGRLKVFASCVAFLEEFRLYRRDAKGRVVKQHDHVCDCVRYLVRSGRARMKTAPGTVTDEPGHGGRRDVLMGERGQSWMQ